MIGTPLPKFSKITEPKTLLERVDHFLEKLKLLHETKDAELTEWVFKKFEFLNIEYSEDQFRRILFGNRINQIGMLQHAHQPDFRKEIFKFLCDALDICKNKNFDTCQRVFSKVQPKDLRPCKPGSLLANEISRKYVVYLFKVYFDYRALKPKRELEEIEQIFPEESERLLFIELMKDKSAQNLTRQLEVTK